MNRAPGFMFYPEKWAAATNRLSPLGYTVYHRIICWMWNTSKNHYSCPNDADFISSVILMPLKDVKKALAEIQKKGTELFKKRSGNLVSFGLKKEALKQKKNREQARDAAKSRWSKEIKKKEMNADASPPQCPPASVSQCIPIPIPIPIPTPLEEGEEPPPSSSKWNWDIPTKQYRTHAGLNSGKWQWDAEKLQDWQQKMGYSFAHAFDVFEAHAMKPEYAGRAFTVADILKKLVKPVTTNAPSKPKTPDELEADAQRLIEHSRRQEEEAEARRKQRDGQGADPKAMELKRKLKGVD